MLSKSISKSKIVPDESQKNVYKSFHETLSNWLAEAVTSDFKPSRQPTFPMTKEEFIGFYQDSLTDFEIEEAS